MPDVDQPASATRRRPLDLIMRLAAVMSALVIPPFLGGVVGAGGAGLCTGGLECLGYLIYGVFIGAAVGVVLAVVASRFLRLPWLLLVCLFGGWIVLAGTYSLVPWALKQGGAAMFVWSGLAIAWPVALGLGWDQGRVRARVIFAAAAITAVVLLVPLIVWHDETGTIAYSRQVMSGSDVTALGPAADEMRCLGPFSPNTYLPDPEAFAYKLVEPPSTKEWYVRVPAQGEVSLEALGEGDPSFRGRLHPVSRDWLATCSTPLHRWALDQGWWGTREVPE